MKELRFTSTHEWLAGSLEVTMGITDHAQQLLGDMVFIEAPRIGQVVRAGDELGVVESVKAASDFYAPVSGTIVAINQAAVEDPSIVNSDPFGTGWLVKIQATDPQELNSLLTFEQYQNTCTNES